MFAVKKTSAATSSNVGSSSASGKNDIDTKSIIKGRSSTTPPTSITLNNIQVHFPFKPYDVQEKYMQSVLTALQNSEHALLESPTGTGKTLCLLCSALAWQQGERAKFRSSGAIDQSSPTLAAASNISGTTQSDAATEPPKKTPIIIYASRTHSQLSQVVRELRNTRYRPRHAVLGSREHMCVHPKVNPLAAKTKNNSNAQSMNSSEINHGCNKLNKERKCMYRNNLEDAGGINGTWTPPNPEKVLAGGEYEQPVLDMEDLVSLGKQHRICPFYHTRTLLKDAELIFVPYNYLFDRDARETTMAEVDFANSILIFDEAHNLEEFASESSSFDLSSSDVAGCVGEIQRALQYLDLNPDMGDSMKDNMLKLKSLFLRFEQYLMDGISDPQSDSSGGEGGHPGEFIFDVFREGANITHANQSIFVSFVKQVGDLIMEFKGSSSGSGTPKLDHFVNCMKRAYGTGTDLLAMARAKSYRVHVSKISGSGSNGGGGFAGGRTISYWCFAPALAMRELSFLNVRSIIITSGTLSPLPSFSLELGLNFPVQLENNHVIQSDQVHVRVLGKGVSGKELSSKYQRREQPEYILELGNTLASLCRVIPGGVLIFFPSYSAMENCVQSWGGPSNNSGGDRGGASKFFAARKRKSAARYSFPQVPTHFMTDGASNPWKRLLARKPIVLEPRSTSDLNDAIAEFKKFISMPKSPGCILMGVCRGKISEGIDFSDDMCRAVIVTGLPFAPFYDPKVKLKREFLDAARANQRTRPSDDGGFGGKETKQMVSMSLSGTDWYNQQAHRAVNQALGRVIRHRHDYGAVLLLDHRFAEIRNREGLSKWLRPHLKEDTIGGATRGLVQFYKESKLKAEKAAAPNIPRFADRERPTLAYEGQESENSYAVRKIAVIQNPGAEGKISEDHGYIQPNRIIKRFDLNASRSSISPPTKNFDVNENSPSPDVKEGLASFYCKARPQSYNALHPSQTVNSISLKSAWSGLEKNPPRAIVSSRPAKRDLAKRHSLPSRTDDEAKLQAKRFFEKAKVTLSNEDLMKTQKFLVEMKCHGSARNSQLYIKTARDLVLLLLDSTVDKEHLQIINSLFPLLPTKYRYCILKLAAAICFEKSKFRDQCKDTLSEQDFLTVKKTVPTFLFDHRGSSQDSVVDAVSYDKTMLENAQKVLSILMRCNGDLLSSFFPLVNERHLRKIKALALGMKESQGVQKAKEKASSFRGEHFVKDVLFRPSQLKLLPEGVPSTDHVEDQKIMADALIKAKVVNQEKKEAKPKIYNPYGLKPGNISTTKDSVKRNLPASNKVTSHATKRLCNGYSSDVFAKEVPDESLDSMDLVDKCLQNVKSDAYVDREARLTRLNGKIKSHVPRGFACAICDNPLKEPLMADCGHSACADCWKNWLNRSNTCPGCRQHTEMKSLAKMVFEKRAGAGAPSLTQICASEDEGDNSCNEELDLVAN